MDVSAKLTINLVPRSVNAHLSQFIDESDWNFLRWHFLKASHYRCVICETSIQQKTAHFHEEWSFHDEDYHMTLVDLMCLCATCYQTKRLRFFRFSKRKNKIIEHLKSVNHWTSQEAKHYIQFVMSQYKQRCQYQWDINVTDFLAAFDIRVSEQVRNDQKQQIALKLDTPKMETTDELKQEVFDVPEVAPKPKKTVKSWVASVLVFVFSCSVFLGYGGYSVATEHRHYFHLPTLPKQLKSFSRS